MFVEVTSMMASVGSSILGSGTDSTRTSRLPCHVTALIQTPASASLGRWLYPSHARRNADSRHGLGAGRSSVDSNCGENGGSGHTELGGRTRDSSVTNPGR